MGKFWQSLSTPYKILVAVAMVLAFVLVLAQSGVKLGGLPLPGAISREEKRLEDLQRTFKRLQKDRRQLEEDLDHLRSAARPFWSVEGRLPAAEVQSQFDKLARRARVTIQSVGAPQVHKVSEQVRSVELAVRFRGTMREVARLLAELEKSDRPFYWLSLNIRPDSLRDPKGVSLTGKIQALVLSPEAARMISGGLGAQAQEEAPRP